jgi:oligopeptide/dipeptide ABC transporter ATP-binding protein
LLEVRNLRVSFPHRGARAVVVDGVSFSIGDGEVLGIVGESGSGKSVTALSILRLIQPPGEIEAGEIGFEGRNLLLEPLDAMRQVRGKQISMIFQEPMTSLNPVFTIGNQIAETVRLHERLSARQARTLAVDLLKRVGIPAANDRVDEFPHQLSGGMRQRVMIAMAIASRPKILIADEPTTALDVTIQAQILDLLDQLRQEFGMAMILITHDMGVIARAAERVLVMYAGRVAEEGPVKSVFKSAGHPYTAGLLDSIPRLGKAGADLHAIPGMVPSASMMPPGCRFRPRCASAQPICDRIVPPAINIGNGHSAACLVHTGFKLSEAGPTREERGPAETAS